MKLSGFTFIRNAVRFDYPVVESITSILPTVDEFIVNVGPDEEFITINQLAKTIARLLGFDLKPKYVAERPQEVKLASCSADKARKLLSYRTQTKLSDGLQSMIDYIKARGTKKFKYHLDLEIINDKCPATWKEKLF